MGFKNFCLLIVVFASVAAFGYSTVAPFNPDNDVVSGSTIVPILRGALDGSGNTQALATVYTAGTPVELINFANPLGTYTPGTSEGTLPSNISGGSSGAYDSSNSNFGASFSITWNNLGLGWQAVIALVSTNPATTSWEIYACEDSSGSCSPTDKGTTNSYSFPVSLCAPGLVLTACTSPQAVGISNFSSALYCVSHTC